MVRTDREFLGSLRDKRERQKTALDAVAVATDEPQRLIKLGRLRQAVSQSIANLTVKLNCAEDSEAGDFEAENRLTEAQSFLKECAERMHQLNTINAMVTLGMLTPSVSARHQAEFVRFKELGDYPLGDQKSLRRAIERRSVQQKIEPFEEYTYDDVKGVLTLHGPNGKSYSIADKGRIALILHVIQRSSREAPITVGEAIEIIRPALGPMRLPRLLKKRFFTDMISSWLDPILQSVDASLRTRAIGHSNERGYYIEWHEAAVPPKRRLGVRILDEPFPGAYGELPSPKDLLIKKPKESFSQLKRFADGFESRYDIYELLDDAPRGDLSDN